MALQPQLITVTDFEQFLALPENRDRSFEIIHGEIVEKVPTEEHGLIAGNTCGFLCLTGDETLTGDEVLPGFVLAIHEIFVLR